ncbi:hypothetical protein ACFSJS_10210 [Streptomyces desertarenae]|uniref:Uncharacterized protein n=1 Tax=Streptomyces desertarenae TaxID=2666184 RepID=A0ABW4PH19_9ACTN
MTTTITAVMTELVGREVVASCLLGSRLSGTGVSGAAAARLGSLPVPSIRERISERPTQAPAAAVVAQADAYVFTGTAANGADNGQKRAQHHTMWAFRGLEPWRDPA